jgi:hypothetical protein
LLLLYLYRPVQIMEPTTILGALMGTYGNKVRA